MQCAINIVKYSVNYILSLIDSTKMVNERKSLHSKGVKRTAPMPNPDVMDPEYIVNNRHKVQKIFNEQKSGERKLLLSRITKMHWYPQCAGVKGAEPAINFLQGLERNGLGRYVESLGQKYFEMIDLDDIENLPEETHDLLLKLGIKRSN